MKQSEFSDGELARLVRESQPDLYSEIIKRYQVKLGHYLKKFIQNPDELEDVLQDVFIKVYKNLHSFDVKRPFSSWIYRVTHNEAVNYLRQHAARPVSLDDNEYQILHEKISLGDRIDAALLRSRLVAELNQLKMKYRTPLMLYYFESRTYEEISDILRVPVNTVGTLLNRGKKMLKKNLLKQAIWNQHQS